MTQPAIQTDLNPRDAGYLGVRCPYLTCRDCEGYGYLEGYCGRSEQCEACTGTGATLCKCCPAGSDDQMAVTTCVEGGSSEPMCQACAGVWVGKIEYYVTCTAPEASLRWDPMDGPEREITDAEAERRARFDDGPRWDGYEGRREMA